MCGTSKASMVTDGIEWCKEVMNKDFVAISYPKKNFEPIEWSHCLATIDVCTINHGIKFCDDEGYDIIPIQMVVVINDDRVDEKYLAKDKFYNKEEGQKLKIQ